jgi:hypothetical protein
MTDQEHAAARAAAQNADNLRQMAWRAVGGEGGRADQKKAQADLVKAVGEKKAKQWQEAAMQQAGARPKGIRRFIG